MNLPDWISDSRWTRIGVQVLAVVVVVALLAAGAWAWYRSQESRGLTVLAEATALAQQAEDPQAPPELRSRAIKAMEAVLAEYPRVSASAQAAYHLGNLKYAEGQYGSARGAYQLALAKGASGAVGALAGMSIGYTWEAEKNYANAVAAYDAVAKRTGPKDFVYEDALTAEGRAQELAGKPAEALELYQRVLRDVPQARRADYLRNRITNLGGRAP
jgi:tetratricopeptide (TPR) repeat protein